jgi:hypothetical protein
MLELHKLYNMDCMDGMKCFPDKYYYEKATKRMENHFAQIRLF